MLRRLLPMLAMAACASKGGQGAGGQGAGAAEVVVPEAPAGDAWRTARAVGWKEMLEDLAEADVVFVSGGPEVDVAVLDYLMKRGRLHAIAIDTFPRTAQAALDDFSFGRIGEAELATRCGALPEEDRHLLAFARERRLPVLALGVEPDIAEAVSRGELGALSEEQRRSLPAIHATDAEDPSSRISDGLRLDVAADVIVRWYRSGAPEGAQLAVSSWSQPPRNLPERLFARSGKTYRTLVALPGKAEAAAEPGVFAKGYADYVWFLGGE